MRKYFVDINEINSVDFLLSVNLAWLCVKKKCREPEALLLQNFAYQENLPWHVLHSFHKPLYHQFHMGSVVCVMLPPLLERGDFDGYRRLASSECLCV